MKKPREITNEEISDYLGGLPKEKMHCSVLGQQALTQAIAYFKGETIEEKEGEVICECFGITDMEIEAAVRENNLLTIEDVTNYTKAGGGCENCHDAIKDIIRKVRREDKPPERPQLSNMQKIKKIEETIQKEISPSLKQDGGNIELVDVIGNRVLVKMQGSCAVCKASQQTLKNFVEVKLKEMVWPDLVVEEVT